MKEENLAIANVGEPTVRMTRAQAAACHAFGGIPPSEALKQQGQKQVLRTSSKRAALDEMNSSASAAAPVQHKRRAVLKDVTNVCCENSYKNCLIAAKILKKNSKQANKGSVNVSKVAPSVAVQVHQLPADSKTNIAQETANTELKSLKVECPVKESYITSQLCAVSNVKGCEIDKPQLGKQSIGMPSQLQNFSKREPNPSHQPPFSSVSDNISSSLHRAESPSSFSSPDSPSSSFPAPRQSLFLTVAASLGAD
ncbi:hypothetical protein CsSME_00007448 [Camellia sinensis var. sinensis]